MPKIITWVDPEGRYRVTSPAYEKVDKGLETETEMLDRVKARLRDRYSLAANHQFFEVDDADQRSRLTELEGTYFRWAGKPDTDGRSGAEDGAWEMDADGRPKVNIVKARLVQMDKIRTVRDVELTKLDVPAARALEDNDLPAQAAIAAQKQTLRDVPQTFDLDKLKTPETLKGAWPTELPAEE